MYDLHIKLWEHELLHKAAQTAERMRKAYGDVAPIHVTYAIMGAVNDPVAQLHWRRVFNFLVPDADV